MTAEPPFSLEPPLYYGVFLAEKRYDRSTRQHHLILQQSLNTRGHESITLADLVGTIHARNGRDVEFRATEEGCAIRLWDDESLDMPDPPFADYRADIMAEGQDYPVVHFRSGTFYLPRSLLRPFGRTNKLVIEASYQDADVGHTLLIHRMTPLERRLKSRAMAHQR